MADVMTNSSSEQVSSYIPPKMWKDCTVEEKLERIREYVKSFERTIISERSRVNNLVADFQNHNHLDGKVVKDIKTYSDTLDGSARLNNAEAEAKGEVYF